MYICIYMYMYGDIYTDIYGEDSVSVILIY